MNTFTRASGTTRQHRGLRSYRWSSAQTLSLLLLFAVNWLLLWLLHTPIQRLWAGLMGWAWPRLGLGPSSAVALDQVRFVGLPWDVVGLQVSASAPSTAHAWTWLMTLALLFIVSLLMPRRQLPWIYFLRAFVFLCAMSVAAFFWVPALLHIEVAGYFNDMMKIGAILLWLLPLMHAVLLYIFPLSVADKLLATLLGVLFLVVSVPLHVVVAALGVATSIPAGRVLRKSAVRTAGLGLMLPKVKVSVLVTGTVPTSGAKAMPMVRGNGGTTAAGLSVTV